MDKQSTIRTIRASYKIDQVENGWTVATSDGNMYVFADSKELAEWFCMIVGVPLDEKQAKEDPLESEIRKLVKSYNLIMSFTSQHRYRKPNIRTKQSRSARCALLVES